MKNVLFALIAILAVAKISIAQQSVVMGIPQKKVLKCQVITDTRQLGKDNAVLTAGGKWPNQTFQKSLGGMVTGYYMIEVKPEGYNPIWVVISENLIPLIKNRGENYVINQGDMVWVETAHNGYFPALHGNPKTGFVDYTKTPAFGTVTGKAQ